LDVHLADIDSALKQRFVTSLRIASADGTRAVYKLGHAWRWWRSVKPLPTQ
jgi:hypothetical protein